jgi:hypothetical protein
MIDNQDNENIIDVQKVDKPKVINIKFKNIKFINERKQIVKRLLQILKINVENKIFSSYELNIDEEKQKTIMSLVPEVEQFFKTTFWYYKKESKREKQYLSIVKSILKDMNIHCVSTQKKIKIDKMYVSYLVYTITSNIDEFLI